MGLNQILSTVTLVVAGHISFALRQRQEPPFQAQPGPKYKSKAWWAGNSVEERSHYEKHTQALEHLFPIAWMHVPKSGESLFNAIIHVPGACPSVPQDFEVTVQSVHNVLTVGGFWDMFGPPSVSCPGAMNPYWMGGHRGIVRDHDFDTQFKGHGFIMLRNPEDRVISAWQDTMHSWPYPQVPIPKNVRTYADGMKGCATRMLTRGGESSYHDTSSFKTTYGPHWGGPCGGPGLPTPEETAKAKKRLDDFVFVGITDEWPLSMCLFHATMRSKCQLADFVDSRTPDHKSHQHYNLTQWRLGGYHDEYDGELYAHAEDLVHQRLLEFGLSVENCKPCFDEAGFQYEGYYDSAIAAAKPHVHPAGTLFDTDPLGFLGPGEYHPQRRRV